MQVIVRVVEREVGFHTSLDSPGQFLELSCFQSNHRTENEVRLSDPISGFKNETADECVAV